MMVGVVLMFLISCLALNTHGFTVKTTEDESFLAQPHYLNNDQLQYFCENLSKQNPDLVQVQSIGRSLRGRDLLVLRIGKDVSRNSRRPLLVPMFKFVANMHGDETIGRQLMIYLAEYLVNNYGKVPAVTQLVDSTDIYLMPSMNPDGFEKSLEGNCESISNYFGRYNGAGVDLNRDFPDRFDKLLIGKLYNTNRQPETIAMMHWLKTNPFVLSANMHGGAVVASYPYDNSIKHNECCEDSPTPDDSIFKYLSRTYAKNHPVMKDGHDCNETFTNGITNGAFWYELNGGMQDFNYVYTNCFELTLELSCCKYPKAEELPKEWYKNKRSMLEYMKLVHMGVKGLIKDINGFPIADAEIVVQDTEEKPVRSTERGEYWRLLLPGTYYLKAIAFGYIPSEYKEVVVTEAGPVLVNFTLAPTKVLEGNFKKLRTIRTGRDDYGFFFPTTFEHHNYKKLERELKDLNSSYPAITALYSIGKSVQGRDLWVLEISKNPGKHTPLIPEMKLIANMHGNEVVGREMLLLLAKYLCQNYMSEKRITRLIDSTRIHLLISMNPDGYEISKEGDEGSSLGRSNANRVDLNRNFPDQYGVNQYNEKQEPETEAVMNWSLSNSFVLSANLHGGALVSNFPFDDSPKDFSNTNFDPKTVKNPTEDNSVFEYLAHVYATAHQTMHLGKPCPNFLKETFPDGITNGADWYAVTGGMQDWSYIVGGTFELTLELGCFKFPNATELSRYWLDNKEALIKYIEQSHIGVFGFVRSTIGTHIAHAAINVDNIGHAVYSGVNGDYFRLLLPGKYNVTASVKGYESVTAEIVVPETGGKSIEYTFELMRDDPQHWSSAYDYRLLENIIHLKYHDNQKVDDIFKEMQSKNNEVAVKETPESADYYNSLKVTTDLAIPDERKLHVLIISSMIESSPVGRELTINLARHVLAGFKSKEPIPMQLLKNVVLHFVTINHKFNDVYNQYEQNQSICNPILREEELSDKLVGAEADGFKDAILKLFEKEKFDLALTFSSGDDKNIQYLSEEPIYSQLATQIHSFNGPQSQNCPYSSFKLNEMDLLKKVTNMIYTNYNVPLFTMNLHCCKMPMEIDLPDIWRETLPKLGKFLSLLSSGVSGYVKDSQGNPLRSALVRSVKLNNKPYKVSHNLAFFHLMLPYGEHELEFTCDNYSRKVIKVNVNSNLTNLKDVILDFDATAVRKTYELTGFVTDQDGRPIENAEVRLKNFQINRVFTSSLGYYAITGIKVDLVNITVTAKDFLTSERIVHMNPLGPTKNVVFKLKTDDEKDGSLSNLLFIFLICLLILATVVLVTMFIVGGCSCPCSCPLRNRDKNRKKGNYKFSLLSKKQGRRQDLFEDEFSDDETEDILFKPSLRNKLQDYTDSPAEIYSTDSEEDLVILPSSRK